MRGLTRNVAIVASCVLLSASVLAGMANRASSASMKELMGDNFQNIQVILYNLVTAHYDKVPGQIGIVRDHALQLSKTPPKELTTDYEKRTFSTYAYQLEYNASNMITVLDELTKHDKEPTEPGKLNIDYLRVVAARHFGEIVTTCVLCHNQFRRHPVQ